MTSPKHLGQWNKNSTWDALNPKLAPEKKDQHPERCAESGHDWVAHPVKRLYVCVTCGAQRTV